MEGFRIGIHPCGHMHGGEKKQGDAWITHKEAEHGQRILWRKNLKLTIVANRRRKRSQWH